MAKGQNSQDKPKKEKSAPKVNHNKIVRTGENRVRREVKNNEFQREKRKNPPVPSRGTARRLRREAWVRVRVRDTVQVMRPRINVQESMKAGKIISENVVVDQESWKPTFQEFCALNPRYNAGKE